MKLLLILFFTSCALAYNVQRNRIVGGEFANEGQFPYQVSQRRFQQHACGGSIINKNTILTAAHCVHQKAVSSLDIVVGTITMDNGIWHDVSHYVMHEDYDSVTVVNDIAVIKLQTSIEYTTNVQPIEVDPNYIDTGAQTVIAGWGYTRWPPTGTSYNLKYFNGTVFDWDNCKEAFEGDRYPVLDSHICSYASHGQGICAGDSGGGLAVNRRLVGIASWAHPCAVGVPDVFTRTSSYIDWINRQ